MKTYIDKIFQAELQENVAKLWELKLNKDDVKVYVKKSGGSIYNKEQPYIRTEILFNSAFSMRKIIQTVCNDESYYRYSTLNTE